MPSTARKKRSQPPARRKPRADALRNRDRILEVAKLAFTRHGADASLDEIAKQAGVGPGTLYRHFPTRADLLHEVFRSELEKLADTGTTLAQSKPPVEALRAWLLLFVDAVAAKKVIGPALTTLVGDPKKVFESSYARLQETVRALVRRAVESGDLRQDLNPADLIHALVGVSNVADGPDWQASARRLVDILIAGSRRTK